MVPAPLLDPKDTCRPTEIVPVNLLVEPTLLAYGFAGLAALRFGAEALPPGVSRVRGEEKTTVRAFALSDSSCHGPETSRSHIRVKGTKVEENRKRRKDGKKINLLRVGLSRKTKEEDRLFQTVAPTTVSNCR